MTTLRFCLSTLAMLICCVMVTTSSAQAQTTSEERPPLICNPGSFVSGLQCSGRYCDNVGISCRRLSGLAWGGRAQFQRFVSEERGGRRDCPRGFAMAGLSCKGRYCDDLSILCVQVPGLRLGRPC